MLLKKVLNVNIEGDSLDSFIEKNVKYKISHNARFKAFKQRTKLEYLKYFVV